MDYFASGLSLTIGVDVLDRVSRVRLGELSGVRTIQVEKNLYNDLRMGAQIGVELQTTVSWRSIMLRLWMTLSLDGEEQKFPILTGVPRVGGSTRTDTVMTLTAAVMDPTCLLDDVIGTTYALDVGSSVTTAISNIFIALGIQDHYVAASASTLRVPFSKPPETTWRQVINELGGMLGYAAAWSDSMGLIRVEPYVDPAKRAEVFELGYGARSVTLPEVVSEFPDELPNHFVLVTSDEDPLIAEGWNDDPDNDYSTVNQRTVPYYAQVQAADQASLNSQLDNVMAVNRSGNRTYQISHRWIPVDSTRVLELQSAGRLIAPAYYVRGVKVEEELDVKVAIVQQSFSWSSGETVAHVQAQLRGAS